MSLGAEPFIGVPYLRSVWYADYERFCDSADERLLVARLHAWAERRDLKETSAQSAFIAEFFERTWGYWQAGQKPAAEGFTAHPQFPIAGAGQGGGTGEADLALGWFDRPDLPPVPQVVCEFKGIRARLDAPQRRKGNNRSPVKQALDYLVAARGGLFGNEPVLPLWAIVTDMNEFRLYWYDRAPHQCLRFVLRRDQGELFQQEQGLLGDDEESRFRRFLFLRLFHRHTLLTCGGRPLLLDLIAKQRFRERQIEEQFYKEYRDYRERLYRVLRAHNPTFPGTPGQLVRIAQTILDRCLFILYCEDMGGAIGFPPQVLRDFLAARSNDRYFDPSDREVWDGLRRLFRIMDQGGSFGPGSLFPFNGGLFRHDPRLDALFLPNDAFCERLQGANQASVEGRINLLYLAAAYNFAAKSDGSHSLSLYTLGRIFEQSITELEILEAEAEGRPSIGKVTKRKRDGVYYTPEWVIDEIVEETLGRRLAELRDACGWREGLSSDEERAAIEKYLARVKELSVLDPACGSGAFLITAARRLIREMGEVHDRLDELGIRRQRPNAAVIIRGVLTGNLYGVDINGASVEITQLALWLHTARRGEPLTVLDHHIRCGNSLIDSRFNHFKDLLAYSEAERERVNVFDWEKVFPEVFARDGFDVVIGNPPYVKLQNFRKVHADMAEYLRDGGFHGPPFASTQTGNFDLFLPFIEQGIRLLNKEGRLGLIAPSLWIKNEYGAALRTLIRDRRHLERWIDLGAHQVFDEAITYTALQFYTKRPNDEVLLFRAPEGPEDLARRDWSVPENRVPYAALAADQPWLLLPAPERRLIERLWATCARLDDPGVTRGIMVGIQTSADYVYHLEQLGPGSYRCRPPGRNAAPFEVAVEDAIMHPLVSGPEAKRYEQPRTTTYILFPYEVVEGRARLIARERMVRDFPQAWAYLGRWERELRQREDGAFDDEHWYRFGRHQNIDKQEMSKLIVAQTVPNMRVCADAHGEFYLDNVRVNGILPIGGADPMFLLGVLNGRVADFVFRRIAAPKSGGYFEANKQFIAPLPVPRATVEQQEQVAQLAGELQALMTRRRDRAEALDRRVGGVATRLRPDHWLWQDLGPPEDWLLRAPASLDPHERKAWASDERQAEIERRHSEIKELLMPGAQACAELVEGELRFLVGGKPVIERVFVGQHEAAPILAQWRRIARNLTITDKTKPERLTRDLRRLTADHRGAAAHQIVALDGEIATLEAEIARLEEQMEALLAGLYELTDAEWEMVKQG